MLGESTQRQMKDQSLQNGMDACESGSHGMARCCVDGFVNGHAGPLSDSSSGEQAMNGSNRELAVVGRRDGLAKTSLLKESWSVRDLICKFSGEHKAGREYSSQSDSGLGETHRMASARKADLSLPTIQVTPATKSQSEEDLHNVCSLGVGETAVDLPKSGGNAAGGGAESSESDFDPNKQLDSPPSEDEPSHPKVSQNPKYQLFLGTDMLGNGSRDPDGPAGENGPRVSRWESGSSRFGPNYRGSLESLASRDWDTMSDRMGGFESPPRVFNSPYTSPSIDYTQIYKMDPISPAASEINLFGLNGRSISPVSPMVSVSRPRYSAYETLTRRREAAAAASNSYIMRTASVPNKRDYIEELTRQLEESQKRNTFLEAESVEMDKERNQIRFEMRSLLVSNEDLLRTNTQLQVEMKRMREHMMEMEQQNGTQSELLRKQESELKEAREMMVEANTQEYAFSFLQQSLRNKIQDAEENLEKHKQHTETLSEKLWRAERELEELRTDKQIREKKLTDLGNSVEQLEAELADALQAGTQATAELSLHQKLKDDTQLRVEELEESLMERTQELQKAQQTVSKLQGEVSGKLLDKEQSLEEEIQLRERIQLQCKQAERRVDDLQMELQAMAQSKEDLAKQIKQAQEKAIDMETDLEELQESELKWASKHKRAIEQTEQLQIKLIQQKDLNDQLQCEKAILERQIRDLNVELHELQTNRLQEDVLTKLENKVKELENSLRTEERNKVLLVNNIGKLERKVKELTEQLEEEIKLATEQKDLMTNRIRSLKRQLNEVEETAGRREAQHRHTQRELMEEREANARLQKQLLDQQMQNKRKETYSIRQTLDSLKLDLSLDGESDVYKN